MITYIIKFLHVLLAMGLLGLTMYATTLVTAKQSKLISLNKNLIFISLLALLTGTLLIYPKHYSFHTLWIQAAYLLIFIYIVSLSLIIKLKTNQLHIWRWRCFYILLISLLMIVMHDAVTKNTLLNKDLLSLFH